MSSSEDCFPFDGTCELSKDADFTLTFDDNSCLKVPKCLLELASPAFKIALRDCEHDSTLHLSETSKDTWILILNYIHPAGRHDNCADELVHQMKENDLTGVLRQSGLHGFESLIQDFDRRVAMFIYNIKIVTGPRTMTQDYGRYNTPCYITLSRDLLFLEAIRTADMPNSEEALAYHLMAVPEVNYNVMTVRGKLKREVHRDQVLSIVNSIHATVKELQDSGCHRASSLLAARMLEAHFCFVPDALRNDVY